MKKKQLMALALVGAMTASTAATMAPARTFAAEETKSKKEELSEVIKTFELKGKKIEGINPNTLTDAQVDLLLGAINDVKLLDGKKIGNYETKKESIRKDFEGMAGYSNLSYVVKGDASDMVTYRAAKLDEIEKDQGKKVKDAEKAYEVKNSIFNRVSSDDHTARAVAWDEVIKAKNTLDEETVKYTNALNVLADEINKIEMYKRLNNVITAVEARVEAVVDKIKTEVDLTNKLASYRKAAEMKQKYYAINAKTSDGLPEKDTNADYEKDKNAANAKLPKVKEELVNKVNRQLKADDNGRVTWDDVNKYISEDGTLDGTKKILIENNLTSEDISKYKLAAEELAAFGASYADATDLNNEKMNAYKEANKEFNAKNNELNSKTTAKTDAVNNLDIAVNAIVSLNNYKVYGEKNEAAKKVKDRFSELEGNVNTATKNVNTAAADLDVARKALSEDEKNAALKFDVELKEGLLNSAKANLETAKKELETVRADYERLKAATKDVYDKYKAYSLAVIKGTGKLDIEQKIQELEKSLENYKKIGKEFNLSEIKIVNDTVVEATAGKWTKDANGVWFYKNEKSEDVYKTSWAKIDGVWYRFDENGAMLANKWFKDTNNRWYWLEASGRMSENQWVYVDGSWFYAYASGAIAENEWVLVNGTWYYAEKGGYIAINKTLTINGTKYSFDASGALK